MATQKKIADGPHGPNSAATSDPASSGSSPPNFNEWLKATCGIDKWVVGRMTRRALERYPNSTFLTQTHYNALVEEHRLLVREALLVELTKGRNPRFEDLRQAFELGRQHR